jgi:dTDP-4-amino-4,6-dideoxygalactose transaminase
VIVPAFTAVPTASAVCALGAVPVPVDVDPATAELDETAARAALTERTRAVVPVHLYGRPARLPSLGVPILEDAAQAHGAVGPQHGRASVATAYSFYPTKNLGGVGDGGALVTDDGELAALARRLRTHGMGAQYVHTEISQNFRTSEIEVAWLRLLLPDLAAGNARRRAVVAAYRAAAPRLAWHAEHPDHVHHLAVLRSTERDALRAALAERGVATGVHYPLALTQQPAYRRFERVPCPEAEAWAATCVSVPCFPELTDDEVAHVSDALAAVQDRAGATP